MVPSLATGGRSGDAWQPQVLVIVRGVGLPFAMPLLKVVELDAKDRRLKRIEPKVTSDQRVVARARLRSCSLPENTWRRQSTVSA